MDDHAFMGEALALADAAALAGEVPVGCVLVQGDVVVARGNNLRERTKDPTAHAEIVAIREAAAARKSWRLDDLTAYLSGKKVDLSRWKLDTAGLSEFRAQVYEAARAVPYGRRIAYRDLARKIATPRHAHAVGNALATNPFRLLVPDHRVILARGATGQSRLGRGWKARLLALEAGQTALEWNGR